MPVTASVEDGPMEALGEGEERDTANLLRFVDVASSNIQQALNKPNKAKRRVNHRKFIQRNVHPLNGVLRRVEEGRPGDPYPATARSSRRETSQGSHLSRSMEALFDYVKPGGAEPRQPGGTGRGSLPMRSRNLPPSFFTQPAAAPKDASPEVQQSPAPSVGIHAAAVAPACVPPSLVPGGQAPCAPSGVLARHGVDLHLDPAMYDGIPDILVEPDYAYTRVDASTPQTGYEGSPGSLGSPNGVSDSSDPFLPSSPDSSSLPSLPSRPASYSSCAGRSAATPLTGAFSLSDIEDPMLDFSQQTLSSSFPQFQSISQAVSVPCNQSPTSSHHRSPFDVIHPANGVSALNQLDPATCSIPAGNARPTSHPAAQHAVLSSQHAASLPSTQPASLCASFPNSQLNVYQSTTSPSDSRLSGHCPSLPNPQPSHHSTPLHSSHLQSSYHCSPFNGLHSSLPASDSSPLHEVLTASLVPSVQTVPRSSPPQRSQQYASFDSLQSSYPMPNSNTPSQTVSASQNHPPHPNINVASHSNPTHYPSAFPYVSAGSCAPTSSRYNLLSPSQCASYPAPTTDYLGGFPATQGYQGVGGPDKDGAPGGLQGCTPGSVSHLPTFLQAFPSSGVRGQGEGIGSDDWGAFYTVDFEQLLKSGRESKR